MQTVTQINTVFENETQGADYMPRVAFDYPKDLTFEAWKEQNLGPGWEQFLDMPDPLGGARSYGFTAKHPARTVWVHVTETPAEETPAEETPAEEMPRDLRWQLNALHKHLQREDLTDEDRLETLRIVLAGAWTKGHTAAMEEGFDLPNPYHF